VYKRQIIGNTTQDYETASTDWNTTSYLTTSTNEAVNILMSDGTNTVNTAVEISGIYDGSWHSVVIVSQDSVSDYCIACTDYHANYSQVSSPVVTIYVDKVSIGTIDHSSITGDLSNTSNAYIGSKDDQLVDSLSGTLALFEYQATNWTTTDVDSFHDDARIRVTSQKAAFHFTGNDTGETGLEAIIG
jgi:hypothetical protein